MTESNSDKGDKGSQGIQGIQGEPGTSLSGDEGSQGIQGHQGIQGVQGEPGLRGFSAKSDDIPNWQGQALKWSVVAWSVLALAIVVGFYFDSEDDKAQQASERTVLVKIVESNCDARNLNKAATRDLITTAVGAGEPTDFTLIPSFQFLDPETQQFLRDVSRDSSDTTTTERLIAFRDALVNEDCSTLATETRRALLRAHT